MKGVDLFSGAGGLTLGLKRAGIEPIVSIENNPCAAETYKSHTPDAEHYTDNIINIDLSGFRGIADIVFGGPPCQPFSIGGLRKGQKDARNMIPAFIDVVALLAPRVFLMENVSGLISKARIGYFHEILNAFLSLGYEVSWRVLNAADYGVPQKRKRLFLIGFRDKLFWFPRPTHGPGTSCEWLAAGSIISYEPLGNPPNCPVICAKYPDIRPSPYAGHVYNGGGRPINITAPSPTILASAGGHKTHWVDTLNVVEEYHSYLLEGGAPREGMVPGARRLTVEESALLQTFPPELKFAGRTSAQYTQVGDAVPPRLAEILGREILQQMNGRKPNEDTHHKPQPVPRVLW